ncbi:MAG: hypothetical protein MUF38_15085 [Anaerolineae bacterium]|jgi:hypothetical protein|nr:hypothetical protein [Anaerolineae bacterium]
MLADELFACGLIQVTLPAGAEHAQLDIRFDMLPSYPALLASIGTAVMPLIGDDIERLVCPSDSVALGVAVSLVTGLPLVWHTGVMGTPTQNFVGAYDIDHPTLLVRLTDSVPDKTELDTFIREAGQVGLTVVQQVALLGDKNNSAVLVDLHDAVWARVNAGKLPAALAETAIRRRRD